MTGMINDLYIDETSAGNISKSIELQSQLTNTVSKWAFIGS